MENDPFDEPSEEKVPTNIAPSAMAFEAGLAVVALILGDVFGHSPLETLQITADKVGSNIGACLWGVLATLPLLALFLAMERVPFDIFRDLSRLVDEKIIPLFSESTVVQLALLAFAAGVGEELLFRGLIQDGLAMTIGVPNGFIAGLVVSSVIFGLCHSITPSYFVLATIMGAYLGLLFWWTDNLLAPIVTHALYDFVAIVYMVQKKTATTDAPRR
jgi:membrane protease YdiL (CAAX protease family)